ncbi:MAG: M20/M25/M40 family metallo-hydrolase, partial [Gammaproteobacteria bacterium]|nr:M20/M25/M40 family metallo-hydrolase [Gammaproteobacteria bacterium]
LTAAARTQGELALLFSSDEEAGSSRCIRDFLSNQHGFESVVVAEPTNAKAVLAHRGIATASMQFAGQAGHASGAGALDNSAVHRAVRWADRALTHAADNDEAYGSLLGIRFNIGRVEGGIKPNIIAPHAELKFGIRTLPGQDSNALLTHFCQLAEPHEVAGFEPGFVAPSLPAQGAYPPADSQALAETLALPVGEPVDFWTEAALFSAAGMTALVFGPGNIAQAHAVNEWVALSQLEQVTDIYARLAQ